MNGAPITLSDGFADYVVEAAQWLHDVQDLAEELKKLAGQEPPPTAIVLSSASSSAARSVLSACMR